MSARWRAFATAGRITRPWSRRPVVEESLGSFGLPVGSETVPDIHDTLDYGFMADVARVVTAALLTFER